jgi:histidinol-phosphatase (PHP family)
MKITKDYHVHEHHSSDAPNAMAKDYCRVAEERGIDEIGFSTHLIITGTHKELGISPKNISRYFKEMEEAQTSTKVKVRVGLEVDYFPEKTKQLESILNEYSFDFILGSLHFIEGYDVMSKTGLEAFCTKIGVNKFVSIYYDHFREAIESCLFDVMAHPDYYRRPFHSSPLNLPSFKEYESNYYQAIDSLKTNNIGIEINSSGWRHGIADCYPDLRFLKTTKKERVKTVTIGSDCHNKFDLGKHLDQAISSLKKAGYSRVSTFENRKNRSIKLSEISH